MHSNANFVKPVFPKDSHVLAIWVCAAPKGYDFSAALVVNRVWF